MSKWKWWVEYWGEEHDSADQFCHTSQFVNCCDLDLHEEAVSIINKVFFLNIMIFLILKFLQMALYFVIIYLL